MALQSFDFTVRYKSGKTHADADCLSRYPLEEVVLDNTKDECEELFTLLVYQLTEKEFDIINAQRQDLRISKILNLLDNYAVLNPNERKKIKYYKIKDGILFRLTINHYDESWNIVVPRTTVKEVIKNNMIQSVQHTLEYFQRIIKSNSTIGGLK